MSWQRFARVGSAGAVLSLACGCGGVSASDAPILPDGGGATDGAPPSSAAVDAAADSGALSSDAASLAQDATPPCTTNAIFMVVSQSAGNGGPDVLEAFHPSTGLLTNVGALLNCAAFPGASIISGLAVDRSGRFYVAYDWDTILPVDTTAAGFACVLPGFNAASFISQGGNSDGFLQPLGIAFVGLPDGSETLYGSFFVIAAPGSQSALGTIDTHSGAVNLVRGDAGAPAGNLTGTGDGRLFVSSDRTETISEVDPTTGASLQDWSLFPSLANIGLYQLAPGNPLAFWADDLFVFSATGASDPATGLPLSDVVRFHPSDNSSAVVGQLDGIVLGAAVSTCAPLH
jgi:hypothetical protein